MSEGRIVWRELISSDVEASRRFYGETVGWKIEKSPMADKDYFLCNAAAGKQVGGILAAPMPSIPSQWYSYIAVSDVDAKTKLAASLGSRVAVPPKDIPNIGRFAAMVDPQGAAFALYKGVSGQPVSDEPSKDGEFCWEQLHSEEPSKALAFYKSVAGWKEGKFQGSDDKTRIFQAGDKQVASFMQTPPGVKAHWLTFIAVDSLAAATERALRMGGKVLQARIEVPTVGVYSVLQDNVGAAIAFFE